jgi:peptidyl-prolyl cis-trans isomerase B (cyclophilin B)
MLTLMDGRRKKMLNLRVSNKRGCNQGKMGFKVSLLVVLSFLFLLGGCGSPDQGATNGTGKNAGEKTEEKRDGNKSEGKNPIVTIQMENKKEIKVELYPEVAPNTVNNFVSLVKKGYYDGIIFHRIIPDFMIQGGDPDGTGMGGPGYTIKGEFTDNNFQNDLRHERGVLSMARTPDPNSAGSQFFIMVADSTHLDAQYASFGKVIEGMDVVDEIVSVDRDQMDKPLEEQRMEKITVETFGVDYPEPEVIK